MSQSRRRGRGWFNGPTHRVSDYVSLPAFWDSEVWHFMHGHGNGRYPAAVMLGRHRRATVFVGVHRTRRDFDADDMATLGLLRQPLAAALAFRAAWHDATLRCRAAIDVRSSEPLTRCTSGTTRARPYDPAPSSPFRRLTFYNARPAKAGNHARMRRQLGYRTARRSLDGSQSGDLFDAGIRQRDNTGIGGPEVIRCSQRAGGAPTRRIGDRDPVKNIEKLLAPAAAPGYNQARRP